jgi:hypothetical protein
MQANAVMTSAPHPADAGAGLAGGASRVAAVSDSGQLRQAIVAKSSFEVAPGLFPVSPASPSAQPHGERPCGGWEPADSVRLHAMVRSSRSGRGSFRCPGDTRADISCGDAVIIGGQSGRGG